jgi:hypothetical protein
MAQALLRHPPFVTNVKHLHPSETVEELHGQLVKQNPISHALLIFVKQ